MDALHRQFAPARKPAAKKRVAKEKRKKRRINQKLQQLHIDQCLELRNRHNLTFREIGRRLTLNPQSVFMALKRLRLRGSHVDQRQHNGRNNPSHKINEQLKQRLLDRDLLQQWSGLNLQQRCLLLERDFNLRISLKGLQKFYRRNGVRYLAVGYIY